MNSKLDNYLELIGIASGGFAVGTLLTLLSVLVFER